MRRQAHVKGDLAGLFSMASDYMGKDDSRKRQTCQIVQPADMAKSNELNRERPKILSCRKCLTIRLPR